MQSWESETRRSLSKEELDDARSILREYGTPELTAFFQMTGAGSHPAMAKLLAPIGRDMQRARRGF